MINIYPLKGQCQRYFFTNNNFRIITNPILTKCEPGAPECIQPSNDFAMKMIEETLKEAAKKVPEGEYLFSPVGMDDGDAEPFVHPDDRKQNEINNNQSCKDKCKGKPKARQCKRNCKKKPGRGQRAMSGGSSGPATKKTPTAGKDCNEKCSQLRGAEKRRCKEKKKKQCKNGKGNGKGKGKGKKPKKKKNRTG